MGLLFMAEARSLEAVPGMTLLPMAVPMRAVPMRFDDVIGLAEAGAGAASAVEDEDTESARENGRESTG
jgi:hypothetical protein